ncbi:MAG: hypothetical protein M3493_06230 [Actinomycetota bacterium]|nr:hypothetical protein [Actinomycetota bacterium]
MVSEHDTVAETVRVEGARILATLIRTVGDVQIAEDAVQEATLAALGAWPVTGVPPQPRAWLTVTARRKAIDILRRERARPGKERDGLRMIELARSDLPPDDVVHDDLLRLIFTCCHSALSPPTRVALALRTLWSLAGADRRRAPHHRGRHDEAPDPGSTEDRCSPHPLPGAGRG